MHLHHFTGFGLALLSMVLYGLYLAPRKQTAIPASAFTFWMGCGILIGASAVGLVYGGLGGINSAQYAIMFGNGITWATGTHAYCRAVQLIGLSRSTPIKNTSAMLGTLLGIVVLHEFASSSALSVFLVVLGSLSVVVSALLLGRVQCPDDIQKNTGSRYFLYGVLCSIWAAIAYSFYTIPIKIAYQQGISPSTFLFYMGQGCFIGMSAMALITRPRADLVSEFPKRCGVTWRDRGLAGISGLMWAVGSLCANIAAKYIGVAVTWPITKNTVVAVLFGVLVLKEVDTAKHKRALWTGLGFSVLGVILLGLGVSRQ